MSSAELGITRNVNPKTVMSNVPANPAVRMKVISMGESGTGKSCLIKRYCEERFVPRYVCTIGVDFGVKKVVLNGTEVKVNFWDLSGNPEFLEVRNEFYKDSQGCILVFDVGQRKTFDQLDHWVAESTKFGGKDLVVTVCGNKVDTGKRQVTEAEGSRWASSRGYMYCETSANTGAGVYEMFDRLFHEVMKQRIRR